MFPFPEDLTTLTAEQTEHAINVRVKMSLKTLRKHQDIVKAQLQIAFDKKDNAALVNLGVREKHLIEAINRKCFPDNK